MTSSLYIDSCIPMYLVGADHPNKARVIEVLPQFINSYAELLTSAEVYQEIIHRYHALKEPKILSAAYDALEKLVHRTEVVSKTDTDQAMTFVLQYPVLSSRDSLHVAIMKRVGCQKIWTYDKRFEEVTDLVRVF